MFLGFTALTAQEAGTHQNRLVRSLDTENFPPLQLPMDSNNRELLLNG